MSKVVDLVFTEYQYNQSARPVPLESKTEAAYPFERPREMGMKMQAPVPDMAVKSAAPLASKPVSGMQKEEPRYRYEIRQIIRHVERLDREQQEFVMRQLGIKSIWYSDYSEIPGILHKIRE